MNRKEAAIMNKAKETAALRSRSRALSRAEKLNPWALQVEGNGKWFDCARFPNEDEAKARQKHMGKAGSRTRIVGPQTENLRQGMNEAIDDFEKLMGIRR
jgi:hypothetical protein